MIERYFKSGVRFLWNKPNDGAGPTNGNIVDSQNAATILTYDGLDGHRQAVDPLLLGTNSNQVLGIRMRANINYSWLDYTPGQTTRINLAGADVLTGYMSGCLIVTGTFGNGGLASTFHIGTDDNDVAASTRVKQYFRENLPVDARGFNPFGAWSTNEIVNRSQLLGNGNAKIFGLVTTNRVFYSILMFNVIDSVGGGNQYLNANGQRFWCVGGIKQVPAMSRVQVMARLLR